MHNLEEIEGCFQNFLDDLRVLSYESVVQVDLNLLNKLNLLGENAGKASSALTRYFNVVETNEKITLVNEEFVIWIIPDSSDVQNRTFVMIALNKEDKPQFELMFVTAGVYNTSKLVLRLLERFLEEIQENEEALNFN